jgi:pimeloyl-ACP methyl ester carboxylesterase
MADTIFMIHGMFGGPWYWDNYRSRFEAEGYRCIAPTLLYHDMDPRAVPHPRLGTTGLLDYADQLEQEIARLDEKPILMGHSMGALLAQILGARIPVKALVLLTPASPYGIMAMTPSVIRSFWSVQTTWGFWKNPIRQRFSEAVYSMLHQLPEREQWETYEKFVYESGRAAMQIGYWFFDPTRASSVDDTRVTCPVLVVAGARDRITPASVVRKVARKYNTVSTYKEFENHSHWVVAEPDWLEVADYAVSWLNQQRAQSWIHGKS